MARFAPRPARVLTAILVVAGVVVVLGWPGLHWLLLPVVALLFGHLGRSLGQAGPVRLTPRVPSTTGSGGVASVPAPPGARQLPATLGRYRIESEIGRGSMGAVYLGHDPQIGRRVAIKTLALSREFHGDKLVEARARFFREAETAGRLQHPDIVTIFDAGEADDLAWIAMEYIKGHDLQRYTVVRRLLPLQQLLPIVARVAEALAYAHRQGIVHRDIKPANVMVDPDTGLVKVTDFGVARISDASRTRTGMVLGTPSFMSPEQMAGRPADGRSDLYSLGVMLYQLLTGTLPHEGDSMAKLMQQIANEPAPDVRHKRPDVPEALADIVALALEKRVEVRYADGQEMAADLRAVAETLAPGVPDAFEKTVTFSREEPRHNSAS
ncbi:MAG: serine/threonine protein kinase [Piscinibacter sp.]|nr:serine/threonine protein kinase [Piscinibacter sp.]